MELFGVKKDDNSMGVERGGMEQQGTEKEEMEKQGWLGGTTRGGKGEDRAAGDGEGRTKWDGTIEDGISGNRTGRNGTMWKNQKGMEHQMVQKGCKEMLGR